VAVSVEGSPSSFLAKKLDTPPAESSYSGV
jgi:hypothetical protein